MTDSAPPDTLTPDPVLSDSATAILGNDASGAVEDRSTDCETVSSEDRTPFPVHNPPTYSNSTASHGGDYRCSPVPPVAPRFPHLDALHLTLNADLPCCWGTLGISPETLYFYYGTEEPRFINFSESPIRAGALEALAAVCDKAKFGHGNETVLDETYRKSGQMDAARFVTPFDAGRVGLMPVLHTALLPTRSTRHKIHASLYKLNVYEQGAFFKPHRDTPRGKKMFGSLVIVLPTPHEGGELVLRHKGNEHTFDGARILAGTSNTIAYVAFFSDVEHEVLPVLSGHRVTLTYNLYHGEPEYCDLTVLPKDLSIVEPKFENKDLIADIFRGLLDDALFLPRGGVLGFGLRHSYPFVTNDMDPLSNLPKWLKGADQALITALQKLGFEPHLWLVYQDEYGGQEEEYDVLVKEVPLHLTNGCGPGFDNPEHELLEYAKGVKCRAMTVVDAVEETTDAPTSELRNVYWAVGLGKSEVESNYLFYGNEASLDTMYMAVCLLVRVGPFAARQQAEADWEVGVPIRAR